MTNQSEVFSQEKVTGREKLHSLLDEKFIRTNFKDQRYVPASATIVIANEKLNDTWSCEVQRVWQEQILDYDIVFNALVRVCVPGYGCRECAGGASFRDHCYGKGVTKSLSDLQSNDIQANQLTDMYKKAAVDATKKALSYFGICEEVYWIDELIESSKDMVEKPHSDVIDYDRLTPSESKAMCISIRKLGLEDPDKFREFISKEVDVDTTSASSSKPWINSENVQKYLSCARGALKKSHE